MADLSQLYSLAQDQELGTDVPIKGFAGEDTDIVFRIAGKDSQRVTAARLKATDERVRLGKFTAARAEKVDIEFLSQAVLSWTGIEDGGQPLPCSPENVVMVLTKFPFIREQVDAAVGSRERFAKRDGA